VFLNSDFHDWPWTGDSCWAKEHYHNAPITRAQWALGLNEFYERLQWRVPDLVIEMHDHIESGEYRTPVWYLFDRPGSYDEKWAYEFMWTTYQDLMDRKLFALYYLRLAEPIPLFLHINASSDNEKCIGVLVCRKLVTHMGVGAVRASGEVQRNAYMKAIKEFNARFDAFALGTFYGSMS